MRPPGSGGENGHMSASPSSRDERIVTVAVTAVALLIGGFFLWTTLAPTGPAVAPPASGAVVFVVANAAAGGLLWWHRRFPIRVFAGILAVYIVSASATQMVVSGALTLPLWFSVFAVAAYAPLPQAVVTIVVGWIADTAVKVLLAIQAGHTFSALDVVAAFVADVGFFYVACSVPGLGFRSQYQRARDATEHARLVEEHARALHAEAVATERNRLARDLHDLAAHELVDALLAVRALQVTNDDPVLPEIEQKAGRALENMRNVVRTLREGEGESESLDQPGPRPLADAAMQLLDDLRDERGMAIDTSVDLDEAVDDAVASTVLSVLKETVLNAARHAPDSPVTVAIVSAHSEVRLTVTNPTRPKEDRRRHGTGTASSVLRSVPGCWAVPSTPPCPRTAIGSHVSSFPSRRRFTTRVCPGSHDDPHPDRR